MVTRATLRVELASELSQSVDTLERLVRFARAMEDLGLEVRITGDLAAVVDAAVRSETIWSPEIAADIAAETGARS